MAYTRIDVARARALIENNNARVIDVRDTASYQAGHIPGADAVDQTNVETFIRNADRSRPLVVCCYHGNMSQDAAEYFSRNGFAETYSLDGGYEAWQAHSPRSSGEADAAAAPSLSEFAESARIWIYGARRALTTDDVQALDGHMARFMADWRSHGRPVTPGWQLVHDQFVIIGADPAEFNLSGCSIDSMFRTLEDFSRRSGLDFTNSGGVVFYRDGDGAVRCVERFAFKDLAASGAVNADTVVFDNTVSSVGDLNAGKWEVPMRESWHMDVFGRSQPTSIE